MCSLLKKPFCAGLAAALALALSSARAAETEGWFAFNPPADEFSESAIDLRTLNEKFAGEHGVIGGARR